MRADRLLSELMLLHVHRRLTARELAERLEVSERTIHRDMEALSASGVPVYAERGTGGGWFLAEGYETKLTGLNAPELQTLFLAMPPRLLQDLGLQNVSEAALRKVMASLPPASRDEAARTRQLIHIDGAGWNRSKEAVPFLPLIQEAVWLGRGLRMVYERADGPVERMIEPLGLVAKAGVWYVVARAEEGELRTYRISRVRDAEMTEQPVERPEGFSLADYWEQSTASFQERLPRYLVTVTAGPIAAARLRGAARFLRIEREKPAAAGDATGWAEFEVTFDSRSYACEFVLGCGADIEVLVPEELRLQVAWQAEAIAARYRR